MAHEQSYLPDFLQDSPYLPLSILDEKHDSPTTRRRRLSASQFLKSKNARRTAILLSIIFLLWSLPSILHGLTHNALLRRLQGPSCYFSEPITPDLYSGVDKDIDWSRYAYTQYVTNAEYLCNSVILFEALERLESKADRVMLYPSSFELDPASKSMESQLLMKARDEYKVKLVPIEVQHKKDPARIWGDSYTKLLAFNQTQYERLIVLDSDATILKHMDELFFVPSAPVTLPQAYWLEKPTLSSHIMVIKPSTREFERVQKAIRKAPPTDYDMEIINRLYGSTCSILPQRPYALLSGEFRSRQHANYLGHEPVNWDPEATFNEAKYVHFSDYPLPKPWEATQVQMTQTRPACFINEQNRRDCRARDLWLKLYNDYNESKKNICNIQGREEEGDGGNEQEPVQEPVQ